MQAATLVKAASYMEGKCLSWFFCSLGMDSWPLVFPQSHSSSQSLGDSNINLKHQEIINVKMYQR